ncbi:hypothetical protein B0H11DRAFT_2246056 [Mycena galericulata]|nr:hypothetical protein B0H11DRAFT_2246056 [Mycena galericulata]
MRQTSLPVHTAAQLTSLTVKFTDIFGGIEEDSLPRLHGVLGMSPLLQHLCLLPHFESPITLSSQTPRLTALPVPNLVTFSGPFCAALGIALAKPVGLTHFTITVQSIPSTADALFLIEHLRSTPLVSIALLLEHWDDQVILSVTEQLPLCEELEVIFDEGGPSQAFLASLGTHHLRELVSLRAVHIYPKIDPVVAGKVSDLADNAQRHAEAWALCNPQLRRVQMSSWSIWARGSERGSWDLYKHSG